jgi:transketolase
VALDGEVSNSTYAEEFKSAFPDRFFEMYIAEQQMIAAAVGISVRGYRAFASTFAAFSSRAYDFIRMAGVSQVNLRLCGSHAGCEIGADGPSQMALEDLAAMRAIHTSTVLYPCDAVSTVKLVGEMAKTDGITYLRTTRGAYPVIYGNDDAFPVGGSKVLRSTDRDVVTLLGAGVTVYACLSAADALLQEGISARVIDLYSVKPVDVATLRAAMLVTDGHAVVVEDHYPQGGLGAAVLEALAEDPPRVLVQLAVGALPTSGTSAELMHAAGIDSDAVVAAAKRICGASVEPPL